MEINKVWYTIVFFSILIVTTVYAEPQYNKLTQPSSISIEINDSTLNVNNSDYLDGYDSSAFARLSANNTFTGTNEFSSIILNSSDIYNDKKFYINEIYSGVGSAGWQIYNLGTFYSRFNDTLGIGFKPLPNGNLKIDNSYGGNKLYISNNIFDDPIDIEWRHGNLNMTNGNIILENGNYLGNGSLLTDVCLANGTGCNFDTTYYSPSQSQVVRGTVAGNLSNVNHTNGDYDGITLNITEASGAVGLDIRMNFTGINSFNTGVMRYYTTAITGEYPIIQVYHYEDATWEDYATVGETSTFAVIEQTVYDDAEHIQNGVVQMRLYKASAGNTNNKYYIDWIAIGDGIATPTGQEVDPFAIHMTAINYTDFNYTNGQLQFIGSRGTSGGMNFTNLALTNITNTFNLLQIFNSSTFIRQLFGYNLTETVSTEVYNGTELPNNRATTPINMTGNVVLLHLNNETGENATFFKDFSGLGNNATCSGTNCPEYVSGQFINNSYEFKSESLDYLSIPNKAEFQTQTITLMSWFKLRGTNAGQNLISKPYNGPVWSPPYLTWMIRISPLTGIEAQVGGNGGYSLSSSWSGTTTANVWTHLTMTYNGSLIMLYKDGVNIYNSTYTQGIGYTTTPVLIGANYGGSPVGNPFNGTIDEVAIFNRTLSATEITNIYNTQKLSYNNTITTTSRTQINLNGTILDKANLTTATDINASEIKTGTVATARLGTGTPSSSTYLRGDGTWTACSLPATGYEGYTVQDSNSLDIGYIDDYGRFIPYYYY